MRSLVLVSLLLVALVNCQRGFNIKIENLSAGAIEPTAFSDVVWALHTGANPLFRPGTLATPGLQSLAEDGIGASLYAEAFAALGNVSQTVGLIPGPIAIGSSIQFGITASPGQYFSFVTMYYESNNDFLAPISSGVPLFDSNDNPTSGIQTVIIYNAGTEKTDNASLGSGVNQAPNQPQAAVGQLLGVPVARQILTGTNFSDPSALMRFTITPATLFTVRLTNLGNTTPFSPPVWAVSSGRETIFTAGQSASPALQALAENGNPAPLAALLHTMPSVLFSGVGSSGPILPGGFVEFTVPAVLGSTFHVASMYGWSNDRFFATPAAGVSLFTSNGPFITSAAPWIWLWDAGTAMDEAPGQGPNQAAHRNGQPRNPAVWPDESSVVKEAYAGDPDGFVYEPASIFQLSFSPVTDAPGFLGSNPNQNLYVNFQFQNMFKLSS